MNLHVHFSLAGVSRSVTITAAYIMTVTEFGWRDTIQAIRGARNCANPNFGFQRQLQEYENDGLEEVSLNPAIIYKLANIEPPAKRHSNGVSLASQ